MATVKAFLRTSTKKSKPVNVRFRLSDGSRVQLFYKSKLTINPALWDAKREEIKSKVLYNAKERVEFNSNVARIKTIINQLYLHAGYRQDLTSEWLSAEIDKALYPEKYKVEEKYTFFDVFQDFLEKRNVSQAQINACKVLGRALKRYELYEIAVRRNSFVLDLDTFNTETICNFDKFLRDEHLFYDQYPQLYVAVPESRTPKPRGQNTISGLMLKLRTFFLWAIREGKTNNNPFVNYSIGECVYGTPIYISVEERNKLYQYDFSKNQYLAVQRDIFVFQCLIGCRVGDYFRMTKDNIIDGAIEYIARKTKDGHPETLRVPLNKTAQEILDRYPVVKDNKLLPFTYPQQYNDDIKLIFKTVGLTRFVTILDPTTRMERQVPLNEIASSHLARRTFVGNIYKKVQDPNLVGALSGHVPGSRAFARYRTIDDEMKRELVAAIE